MPRRVNITSLTIMILVIASAFAYWIWVPQGTRTVTVTSTISSSLPASPAAWEVCFSPKGACSRPIISWFDRANKTIHVMIYSFTNDAISSALVRAKQRNVVVKIIFDDEQSRVRGSEYSTLVSAGLDVKIDRRGGLMHNKVAIIDGLVVITGSYNWSAGAEEVNRENSLIIKDQVLASRYEEDFARVWSGS